MKGPLKVGNSIISKVDTCKMCAITFNKTNIGVDV